MELGGDNISDEVRSVHNTLIRKYKPKDKKQKYTFKQILTKDIKISDKEALDEIAKAMKEFITEVRTWEKNITDLLG